MQLLRDLRFGDPVDVAGRASIADLFRPGRRCGIYVLHFTTGELYTGQAVDVTRRYVQHRGNHGDIEKISFRRVGKQELSQVEREVIAALERESFQLRNIALTSTVSGESDFDLIMPQELQDRWISECSFLDLEGSRAPAVDLRRKYQPKYEEFQWQPHAPSAVKVLRQYVRTGIPAVKRGEMSFWSCSCLPAVNDRRVTVYSRINIFWQEVLTVWDYERELRFSWHLARWPLEEVFGESLAGLKRRYRWLSVIDHRYTPGGADQINLEAQGAERALELIRDADILHAVRSLNLRLAKKGPCVYSRYHCPQLADLVIQPS